MASLLDAARRTTNGRRATPEPSRVPGEPGMWIFILGDLTAFTVLFCVFLSYRAQAPRLFAAGAAHLEQGYGVAMTLLLLTSSLLVVTALHVMRTAPSGAATRLVAGALVCGLGFVILKVIEWSGHAGHGFRPTTDDFWSWYYVLTGLHLAHLLLGMAVLTWILAQSRRPALSAGRLAFVEGGLCFWHMVDMLWIVIFALLYLLR